MERLTEVRDKMPPDVKCPYLGPVSSCARRSLPVHARRPDDPKRPLTKTSWWRVEPCRTGSSAPSCDPYLEWRKSTRPVATSNSTSTSDPIAAPLRNRQSKTSATRSSRNNANSGGGILPEDAEQYLVRGVGLIRDLDDIRSIVLKEVNGTLSTSADVAAGEPRHEVRYGASSKAAIRKTVGVVRTMIAGGNAKDSRQPDQGASRGNQSQRYIPDGLQISRLLRPARTCRHALHTVNEVLDEGVAFVVVIVFLFSATSARASSSSRRSC